MVVGVMKMAINKENTGFHGHRDTRHIDEEGDADVSSNEDSDDVSFPNTLADMPGRKFVIDIDALDQNLRKQNGAAITPTDPDPVITIPRLNIGTDVRPQSTGRPQSHARLSYPDIGLPSDRTSSSQSMNHFFDNDEVFLVDPPSAQPSPCSDMEQCSVYDSKRLSLGGGIDNRGYSPCDLLNETATAPISTSALSEGVHAAPRSSSRPSDRTASSPGRTPPAASMAILMCDYQHRQGAGDEPMDLPPHGHVNPLPGAPLHTNNNGYVCGQPQCDLSIGFTSNGSAAVPNDLASPVMVHDLATRTETVVEIPQDRAPITFKKIVRQLSQSRGHTQDQYVALRGLRKPSDHFDLALFSCVCCVSPFGLAALVMSALTQIRFEDNDLQGALKYSRLALMLAVTGIIVTVVIATVALGVSAYLYYVED